MIHWRPEPQVFADPQQLPWVEPAQVMPAAAPHLPLEEVGSAVEVEVFVLVLVLVVVVLVLVEVTVLKMVEVMPPVFDAEPVELLTLQEPKLAWQPVPQ